MEWLEIVAKPLGHRVQEKFLCGLAGDIRCATSPAVPLNSRSRPWRFVENLANRRNPLYYGHPRSVHARKNFLPIAYRMITRKRGDARCETFIMLWC
jgi:hypothetical protein